MKPAKKFLLKLALFMLPIALLFSPVFASGEMLNSAWPARAQAMGIPLLYGPRYAETHLRYYKSVSTKLHNAQVLVLGDSRPLEIRSFFFSPGVSVYNAAYSAPSPADMLYFLENHRDEDIEVLLMSVSHFAFNAEWAPDDVLERDYFADPAVGAGLGFADTTRSIWDNVRVGAYSVFDLFTSPGCVGVNAQAYGNGILNDGSYYYGDAYAREAAGQAAGERIAGTLTDIENGWRRFAYSAHVSQAAVDDLHRLLEHCQQRGIHVIAFAPPYAPSVNDAMAQKGDAYGYQHEFLSMAPELFQSYGYEFYDYTSVAQLGCTDANFIDGYHAGDVVFLRMFIDMVARGSMLGRLCDREKLVELDAYPTSPLRLLDTWRDYHRIAESRAG